MSTKNPYFARTGVDKAKVHTKPSHCGAAMTDGLNKTGPAVAGPELLSHLVTELRGKKTRGGQPRIVRVYSFLFSGGLSLK